MDLEAWAHDVDVDRPSVARMYDYYLGGSHNFTADRIAAAKVVGAMPAVPRIARANRAFLHRAIRYLLGQGVRQFLDVGSGIPTVGNVHDVAQRIAPETRVVYADVDTVAVALFQRLLEHNDRAVAIRGDLTQPKELITHPDVRGILDLDEPVGVLMVAVLPFVRDDAACRESTTWLRDHLPVGSHLALSHGLDTGFDPGQARAVEDVYEMTATPVTSRSRQRVLRFLSGFHLVEPGLVPPSRWRPDAPEDPAGRPEETGVVVGVGRVD
ncbi:MAG: SAM-dependent methyltransferase [Micromonosporaceae bacterium]|nr:SAM-dependent methyltransferase [Micromonosporaceae bacterium]